MREERKVVRAKLQLIDNDTKELIEVRGETEISNKYYSIKNLNKRIAIMDLFTYQSELCKSSKDILMFRDFLLEVNKYNEFRGNISKFCKKNSIDNSRFYKFLKKSIEIGFTKKIDRGLYFVNPLVFQSKGSTNSLIEEAQSKWINE